MSEGDEASPVASPGQKRRARQYPRRERRLVVRLSEEEHALLCRAAERAGLRPAGFVAQAALATAGGRRWGTGGRFRWPWAS